MNYDVSYNVPSTDLSSVNTIFSGVSAIVSIISLAITILSIVSYWKIFSKAGEPGWAYLIPFYNLYVCFKITFGNGWKFLLLLVPIANIVFAIMYSFKLAHAFGKSTGFGFGLLFLSAVFIPLLAFGDSDYIGPQ